MIDGTISRKRSCAALARIDGLDVEAGLRSVRNQLPQYLQRLRLFAEVHGDTAGQVRRALTAGRFELARRAAHTLKGAAGAIGATAVRARAEAVESPLKHGRPVDGSAVDAALGELEKQLERFIAAVNALDRTTPGTGSGKTAASARAPIPG